MIISRLRVRGKLNLILLLPLAAVVLVAVPFVAGQIQNARSSTTTADAAHNARQLGALVWELQRERLVTTGYLADPSADDAVMVLQQQAVADRARAVSRALGANASDELASALIRLGSLDELRQNARRRGAALDSVARAYHAVIKALIDALRLVPQRTSDAEGTRQLTALDALLRANEESALRGMALVAAAVRPQIGRDLLATASAQSQMFTERFVQQADADQAALVVLVDQGEVARRVDALARRLPRSGPPASATAFAGAALAAAEAQAGLRRLVQERVTSQIADAAAARAAAARTVAWSVGVGASALFALVIVLAVIVSRSIANPLRRLTQAAGMVADLANAELLRVTDVERADERPPRLAAIDVPSGDEVGDLATAFNRVQATAALLLERQVVTRRNVSQMFANVAQRTQNLVRRQIAVVDELERDEQDTRLLSRLYRLDHLSTRLRRNAENLLVIAGSRNETRTVAPAPLTTVLRSALAEIEDYRRVDLGTVKAGTVAAPLVPDLVLVFAELLENATAFSPPESTVDVHSESTAGGWCQVTIVDHGIGMTAARLAEENRRLVERERLDIAPTSVLGLFVVGRLARRHGLAVELVSRLGEGTTATVAIPPSLYISDTAGVLSPEPARTQAGLTWGPPVSPPPGVPAMPVVPGGFRWFTARTAELPTVGTNDRVQLVKAGPVVWLGEVPAAAAPARRGSAPNRRVPGAQLPTAAHERPDRAPALHAGHDAPAARAAMNAFQSALARAAGAPAQQSDPAAGPASLSRRTPGASLAPGLRDAASGTPTPRATAARQRDPDAERAAFDGYVASLAEAARQVGLPTDQEQSPPRTKEGRP
jgi:signal transduction histidine kinase